MHPKRFRNHQEQISYEFMHHATRGHIGLVERIYHLIVPSLALLTAIFLRHRFGSRALNLLSLFWCWVVIGIIMLIIGFSHVPTGIDDLLTVRDHGSNVLLNYHLIIFLLFGIYRVWTIRRDLRRNRNRRLGDSYGDSLLWSPVSRVLEWLHLAPAPGEPARWFQMDHWRFQKWVEPGLLLALASLISDTGYPDYGYFLIASAICLFLVAVHEEAGYYQTLQNMWDAELSSHSMGSMQHDE